MLDLLTKPWVATCSETRDQLSDYVDGELGGRRLQRVRRHLARCERCRAILDSLTRALEGLRAIGAEAQPVASVERAVLTRIRQEEL